MSVAMASNGSIVSEQHQHQHQRQSSQFMPAVASTSSSSTFIPLPPIRRTSTFDLLRKKGLLDDDSDTAPSPIEKDTPPVSPVAAGTARAYTHVQGAQGQAQSLSLSQPRLQSQTQTQAPGQGPQTNNGQLPNGHSALQPSPHNPDQSQAEGHSSFGRSTNSNLDLNPNLHGPGPSSSSSSPPANGPVVAGPASQAGASQPTSSVQMHPHHMMMGRGGAASPPAGASQVPPGQMMFNGQGATFSLPGGRQWTYEESVLQEPLNASNRNRSGNSPQTFTAYDKETEEAAPLPHANMPPPQPLQQRKRASSTAAPPTAAGRYPELFSAGTGQQPIPRAPGPGPVLLSQHPVLRGQDNPNGLVSIDNPVKEPYRVEQESVSSMASDEANEKGGRRPSTSLFGLGHRRNSSTPAANPQLVSDGPAEKKKKFFASVAGIGHPHSKPKPTPAVPNASTFEGADQLSLQNHGDTVPVKKRLSELKGMIKGVGNAKEGAKDDQPVKVETIYESRPSMQGPPRNSIALPGVQGPRGNQQFSPQGQLAPFGLQPQQNTFRQQPPMQGAPIQGGGQPAATNPSSFDGLTRVGTGGPQTPQSQPQAKSDEVGKKTTAGGFLGSLFTKQGNKAKEVKAPTPQPAQQQQQQQQQQPQQRPTQQPTMQPSLSPFRPGQMNPPGQRLGPHPMLAGQPPAQRPGQLQSSTMDPSQPAPLLRTAQIVTIRRPSEITVSSQSLNGGSPQPNNHRMPSPQASQVSLRQHAGPSPLGHRATQAGQQKDGGIQPSQPSPLLSDKASRERLSIGAAPTISRVAPNRKPVGSANSRINGPYMTSAVPAAGSRPERSTASPSPRPGDKQGAPGQPSSEAEKDVSQPSLPSPAPSPAPSSDSSSPMVRGDKAARDSPEPRGQEQGLGVFPNGVGSMGNATAAGPGGGQNALRWGPNGFRPTAPPLIPPSTEDRANPAHAPNSPAPSMDQGKLSKFFGAYDGGKPAAQPQANKERSAASKFLGAFKRGPKNNETPLPQQQQQQQQRPQTSPQVPQNATQPGMPGTPGATPSPSGTTGSMGTPTEQVPRQMQPGPGQVKLGLGPMQAGRGQPGQGPMVPGMMQGGRGQPPPFSQQPGPNRKQGNEPQYDQVPIPRGYEAVHGYGPGTLLAPSPYNAGRPGLPPMHYAQHPSMMQVQPGYPLQPVDPRTFQHTPGGMLPGTPPGVPQPYPQGVPPNHPLNLSTPSAIPPQQSLGAQVPRPHSHGPTAPASHPSPQQAGAQGGPISGSPASSGAGTPQSQHTAPTTQHIQGQGNPMRHASPVSVPGRHETSPPPGEPIQIHQGLRPPPKSTTPNSTGGVLKPADATRLTSRMSVSRQPAKKYKANAPTSLSPVNFTDRTTSVSPEPPRPVHQVSDQDLSVSVDRTSNHNRKGSEDIYDATPRLPSSTFQAPGQVGQSQGEDQAHENTKYAGSDRSRSQAHSNGIPMAGSTAAAAGISAAVVAASTTTASTSAAGDNMSFLDGPDDSEPDDGQGAGADEGESKVQLNVTVSPPQQSATITVTMEPEEKILVDQPVELAAVNDDDDGLPMMTATSYPGQEWNPYGAGEFGDWE
ncbi:hypothetical protein GGS20DRAFT_367095 [Poronia punctata]|nr:hypothetical protein GGS20DRAFT_367095 [Poronia punctata]